MVEIPDCKSIVLLKRKIYGMSVLCDQTVTRLSQGVVDSVHMTGEKDLMYLFLSNVFYPCEILFEVR